MRILLANKFYYPKGGDCIYTMNVERLLVSHGHDVAVFSMQHPDNHSTPWQRFFPSEVSFRPGKGLLKAIARPFGTKEVRHCFSELLDTFQPDVIHLNNIHSQLSPQIGELAHQRGIKVIWTLHDYKLICPRYDCMLHDRQYCQACQTSKWSCLKHRCVKNSMLASYIGYREMAVWNKQRLSSFTDFFICPSQHMLEEMEKCGFSSHQLVHLNNFIDVAKCQRDSYQKGEYYCYFGRLSKEKGVRTLVEAANSLPYPLLIIGDGPLREELEKVARPHIRFIGRKDWDALKKLVGESRFSVLPSECNENNPLSIIESKCLGTPVLGSHIGGIPELITNEKNGLTFKPYDKEDLRKQIDRMWRIPFNYTQIATDSTHEYNAETYYRHLINLYQK